MATVCHHDIPLFLCDMHTPGERQHFSVAMLIALSCQLPSNATIGLMYDVGCVLDRSVAKYNLIPEIAPRLSIAVSVFHAYAHQFCCQIAFHPWKCNGFGKSNREGNEWLWSSMVDMIAPERMMSVSPNMPYTVRSTSPV
ncbi:uncharacterized protein EI90DRAFT_3238814 [Cantharellus anzutake]|uniref:uncharacterized protein n=1 Tax=Cantharellus anzutake TaxID=1750568 RepID=UPI001908D66C|nr:uncharacterized protein EI90DRAFT_3238814 [Cantharellus anzutake]KAF8325059.1 hypothetical protein EI90DRAFT_3238814 [Cantharellus anzutake]